MTTKSMRIELSGDRREQIVRSVRKFFGLSREEGFYLFHAGKYDDPNRQAVIARVRSFVEGR